MLLPVGILCVHYKWDGGKGDGLHGRCDTVYPFILTYKLYILIFAYPSILL